MEDERSFLRNIVYSMQRKKEEQKLLTLKRPRESEERNNMLQLIRESHGGHSRKEIVMHFSYIVFFYYIYRLAERANIACILLKGVRPYAQGRIYIKQPKINI